MAMGDLKAKTPTEVLDVLGRVCPYPLVLTKKQIEKMGSGQLLKILCDAPASAEDSIPRFAEKSATRSRSRRSAITGKSTSKSSSTTRAIKKGSACAEPFLLLNYISVIVIALVGQTLRQVSHMTHSHPSTGSDLPSFI
jgi:tRNA 2-thiouridine synthesizing protein A